MRLRFTPKALNNIAQGRGASSRTLGTDRKRCFYPEGVTQILARRGVTLSGYPTHLFALTQGARRSAATLGGVVERLRRKAQKYTALQTHLESVGVSNFEI